MSLSISIRERTYSRLVSRFKNYCAASCHLGAFPRIYRTHQIAIELRKRQQRGPQPVQDLNHHVNTSLGRLIESCMAFDPAKRPQSAEELKLSLQSELSVERHSRRWIRAHRRLSWTALLLGLTVTGLFVYEVATRDDYYIRQLRLGSLAVEQGQYTEAVDHYSAAVDSFEDVPHSHPGRVGSLFARGRAALAG